MSAQILQFRDYQQKRDIERAYEELNKQAIEIANVCFPSVFGEVAKDWNASILDRIRGVPACDPCGGSNYPFQTNPNVADAERYRAPEKDPA